MIETKRFSSDDGDYSQMENKTLIVLLRLYLLCPFRLTLRILHAAGNDHKDIFNVAPHIVLNPEENAQPLFCLSGNDRAIGYLIDWKLKRVTIEKEIERRLAVHGFSRELLKLQEGLLGSEWLEPIKKELGPKANTFYKRGDEDIRDVAELEALDKAIKLHDRMNQEISIRNRGATLPGLLPADLNMPEDDPPESGDMLARWFYTETRALLGYLLPAMDGELDAEGRKKMIQALWKYEKRAKRRRKRKLPVQIEDIERRQAKHALMSTELNEREKKLSKLDAAIEQTALQYGPKFREYISLRDDLTQKVAAEKVGVDPSTGRRWEVSFKNTYKKNISDKS